MSLFRKLQFIATDGERFLMRFPYSLESRAKLNGVQGAVYNPMTGYHEVPATSRSVKGLEKMGFVWTPEAQHLAFDVIPKREQRLIELSKAKDYPLDLEYFGKPPMPFQRAGIAYAIEQERVIIADEMGLGKTIQGLGALYYANAFPCLVIALSSNKFSWAENEIPACLPGRRVVLADKLTPMMTLQLADVIVTNPEQLVGFRKFKKTKTVDGIEKEINSRSAWSDGTKKEVILSPLAEKLKQLPLLMIIVDEAHCMKEESAALTHALMAIRKNIRYRILLTGTPAPNRASEFTSLLKFLDALDEFGGRQYFLEHFCGLQNGRFGPEAKETLNTDELNSRLRASRYVRRLKADVWDQMPDKTRVSYPVEIDNRPEYEKAEKELIEWVKEQVLKDQEFLESLKDLSEEDRKVRIRCKQAQKAIIAELNERLVRFNALMQITARGKLNTGRDWIKNFLQTDLKLVVFAKNKAILTPLLEWFPDAARIVSSDDSKERERNVYRFQTDPDCRLIIGGMGTSASKSPAGVGHTLTAASNVFFMQLGFNPALHDQCEDRCHRLTQTQNVTAHYLLGRNTIDMNLVELIESKRQLLKQAVDGDIARPEAGIIDNLMAIFAAK